jgi:hypothetical protein
MSNAYKGMSASFPDGDVMPAFAPQIETCLAAQDIPIMRVDN